MKRLARDRSLVPFPVASLLAALALVPVAGCKRDEPPAEPAKVTPQVAAAVPTPSAAPAAPATAPTAHAMLPEGSPLPNITAVAQNGETVKLAELKGKPVVVYFYPKDDTPGCTVEAQEIRDLYQDIKKTSAVVIGVSSDDDASHKAFAEKHALPFLLLPDSDHAIAEAFKVPLKNGRATRATFVFGRDGKLAKVYPAVTPRGHANELLGVLRDLPGA